MHEGQSFAWQNAAGAGAARCCRARCRCWSGSRRSAASRARPTSRRATAVLLQLGIAEVWSSGGGFVRHAEALAGPGAQVHVLAAFASRTAGRDWSARRCFAAAGRAAHHARLASAGVSGCRHARTSGAEREFERALSLLACSRSAASWRISRTDTISRLPLISGTSPSAGSRRRRSNWKVRPCGRFCCNWPWLAITFCGVPESRSSLSSRWIDSASGASVEAQRSRSAWRVRRVAVLPGVVGRQVELAGAAGDADAAADAHEPVVLGQRLAGLAGQVVQRGEAAIELADDLVEHAFGDGRDCRGSC